MTVVQYTECNRCKSRTERPSEWVRVDVNYQKPKTATTSETIINRYDFCVGCYASLMEWLHGTKP